jgi:hypothetical protein
MRLPRARLTLRRMMAIVAFCALVIALALDIYPSVGKFTREDRPSRSKRTKNNAKACRTRSG